MASPTKTAVATLIAFIASVTATVLLNRPHSTQALHAETIVTHYETGIPGISKWYEATITNRGLWPVVVTRCNAVDDAGGKETIVAYAVERWDQNASRWNSVVVFDSSNFCKPYPLGITEAHLYDRWLWPGQSLSTGEEITAARLHKGDVARFVVFTATAGDYQHCVATKSFVIDEGIDNPGPSLRVRH